MLQKIVSNFIKLDMYGHRIDLYINNTNKVKSKFGAFFSLMIYIFSIYFFIVNFINWQNEKNLHIISSSESYNVRGLLAQNQSFVFDFNYLNYYLYFVLNAYFPDKGTYKDFRELERYFTQKFYYLDSNSIIHEIEMETCSNAKENDFLLQDNDVIKENSSEIPNWGVCLKNNFSMGLFSDIKNKVINQTVITYNLLICENSTENNFSCASQEEIMDMVKYIGVQASIPKSLYDFNNPKNPRKRTYDYQYYHIDYYLFKWYTGNIIPVYVKTDQGMLSEDYELNSIDFNIDGLQYEMMLRNSTQDKILFQYDLLFGFQEQIYYRKNQSLNDLIGNFGGIVNILFILGQFLCYSYNLWVLKFKLINIQFANLENLEKRRKYTDDDLSPNKNMEKTFKFSVFSNICPRFTKHEVYGEALKNHYEYMDVHNIIKRLQDIDKLKLVLFDENQRRLFETLPKPGILGKSKMSYPKKMRLESIVGLKTARVRKSSINKYKFLLNGDPLNSRILDLISPNFKKEVEKTYECSRRRKVFNMKESASFPYLGVCSARTLNIKKNNSYEDIPEEKNNIGDIDIPEENIVITNHQTE